MFNKYPYTDFHELNLDWFLKQFKELVADWEDFRTTITNEWAAVQQEWTDTKEAWQTLYNYVHDYFDNLDVQAEIDHKLDEMVADGTMDTIVQPYIDAYANDLRVLEARMDTFASLPDGSTAGDAELLDIRIGANGVTYPSAGDAVRSQITNAEDNISAVMNYATSSINDSITVQASSFTTYVMNIEKDSVCTFKNESSNAAMVLYAIKDGVSTTITPDGVATGNSFTFTAQDHYDHVRIFANNTDLSFTLTSIPLFNAFTVGLMLV